MRLKGVKPVVVDTQSGPVVVTERVVVKRKPPAKVVLQERVKNYAETDFEDGTLVEVVLPVPPSANNMYGANTSRGGKHFRYKTKEYDAWLKLAGPMLDVKGLSLFVARGVELPLMVGMVAEVSVYTTAKRSRDVDNFVKPLNDLLSKGRVWVDDRRLIRICAEKFPVDTVAEEKVVIRIKRHERDWY